MKFITYKSRLLVIAVVLIFGLGLNACISEEVVLKTLEEYESELNEIVKIKLTQVDTTVMGYNKGDFRIDTLLYEEITKEFKDSLEVADSILSIEDITIEDVMYANYIISSPGDDFDENVWISDRRPLHEVVVYADTLLAHTPAGDQPGMAPQAAVDRFSSAITQASFFRSTYTTIERQVESETEELTLEIEIFEEAIIE
jgi:hypothetical protein